VQRYLGLDGCQHIDLGQAMLAECASVNDVIPLMTYCGNIAMRCTRHAQATVHALPIACIELLPRQIRSAEIRAMIADDKDHEVPFVTLPRSRLQASRKTALAHYNAPFQRSLSVSPSLFAAP
jgi:hypothetical protein